MCGTLHECASRSPAPLCKESSSAAMALLLLTHTGAAPRVPRVCRRAAGVLTLKGKPGHSHEKPTLPYLSQHGTDDPQSCVANTSIATGPHSPDSIASLQAFGLDIQNFSFRCSKKTPPLCKVCLARLGLTHSFNKGPHGKYSRLPEPHSPAHSSSVSTAVAPKRPMSTAGSTKTLFTGHVVAPHA